jgi:hypothetical protein
VNTFTALQDEPEYGIPPPRSGPGVTAESVLGADVVVLRRHGVVGRRLVTPTLRAEADVQHVAVLHGVVLPLEPLETPARGLGA